MKGEKITSVNPLEGVFNFLSEYAKVVADPETTFRENRAHALDDQVGDIRIDTCIPSDTNVWETGIKRGTDPWIIVSQYETEEEAIVAHGNWVSLMKTNPTCELKDIDMWNLESK